MGNKRVIINVRKRHIAAGLPASPESCPIALAARERLTNIGRLKIGPRQYWIYDKILGCGFERRLPKSASRFVYHFDRKDPVAPFQFQMIVPAEVVPV